MEYDTDFLVSSMWQLYRTDDPDKIGSFFRALAKTFDAEALDECIEKGWNEE